MQEKEKEGLFHHWCQDAILGNLLHNKTEKIKVTRLKKYTISWLLTIYKDAWEP